jgi:hypothetical protein
MKGIFDLKASPLLHRWSIDSWFSVKISQCNKSLFAKGIIFSLSLYEHTLYRLVVVVVVVRLPVRPNYKKRIE